MTEMIYVKPSPGGRIRMPERNFVPMPDTGAWVPRIDFYERLLIGSDVVICDPPAPAAEASENAVEPDAAPAPELPPAAETSKKSRG